MWHEGMLLESRHDAAAAADQTADQAAAQSADEAFVERALMPHAGITASLVHASAARRIDDFKALARVVEETALFTPHRARWRLAREHLEASATTHLLAVGSSPLFRNWLHAAGRALILGAPPQVLDPLLASVCNYTIGVGPLADGPPAEGTCAPDVPLVARHGWIESWDCQLGLRLPSGTPDGEWSRDRTPEAVRPAALLTGTAIAVRNDLPGLRVTLDESRVPERGETVIEGRTDTRAQAYPEGEQQPILQAASLLARAWPQAFEDWRHTMRVVVPRLPPPGWKMEGFTLSSMQGASWIHPQSTLVAYESLVHEHGHVKLRYVEESVPLLAEGQTDARFRVGWRTDERPVVGVFEGVFVHIHCLLAFGRYLDMSEGSQEMPRECVARRWLALREQAREGLGLLRTHARFTPAGQGFVHWAEAALSSG